MQRSPLNPRALLLAVLCALASANAAPPPSNKASSSVGFRVLERTDASRVSPRFPQGRPLQIAIWYPAASSTAPLTYRDYFLLSTRELSFAPVDKAVEREAVAGFTSSLVSAGVKPEEAAAFLSTKLRASRNAAPLPGRFPLVLLAQGNGHSAHDQAFLAEELASHGYVVATVPSQARLDGPMQGEQDIPAQAKEQAADLTFVLRTLRSEPQVRASGKYGLVAHSFGTRSALLLAMRDPDAAALVSLDGGIGGKAGKGWLERTRSFDPTKATLPILHLYEVGDRSMVPDHELLRSLDRANRWLVKVDGMRHVHFTSLGLAVRSLPALAEKTSAEKRTAAAWDAMAAATTRFLDTFLGEGAETNTATGRWTPPSSPLLHPEKLPSTGG
jgi:predicted dienelactone hydrolase